MAKFLMRLLLLIINKEAIEVALKNNTEAKALNSDWTFKI